MCIVLGFFCNNHNMYVFCVCVFFFKFKQFFVNFIKSAVRKLKKKLLTSIERKLKKIIRFLKNNLNKLNIKLF